MKTDSLAIDPSSLTPRNATPMPTRRKRWIRRLPTGGWPDDRKAFETRRLQSLTVPLDRPSAPNPHVDAERERPLPCPRGIDMLRSSQCSINRKRHADWVEILKAAVPFEVELTPPVLAHLRAENVASDIAPASSCAKSSTPAMRAASSAISNSDRSENPLIVSLTHLHVRRTLSFAAAVLDYQKHRIKKLKKQQSTP